MRMFELTCFKNSRQKVSAKKMFKLFYKNNPQFSADLVTFTEEILNGKLHFLCSDNSSQDEFLLEYFKRKYLYNIMLVFGVSKQLV